MAKTFQKADFLFSISFLDFDHAFIPLSTNFQEMCSRNAKFLNSFQDQRPTFPFFEYSNEIELNVCCSEIINLD